MEAHSSSASVIAARLAAAETNLNQRDSDVHRLVRLNEQLQQQCESYAVRSDQACEEATRLQARCRDLEGRLDEISDTAARTAGEPARISQLQSLLQAADGEISAQIKARLELEAQLRVQVTELRHALSALQERGRQVADSQDREKKMASDMASLNQRLAAVRSRRDELEKQVAALQQQQQNDKEGGGRGRQRGRSLDVATLQALQTQAAACRDMLHDAKSKINAAKALRERVHVLEHERSGLLSENAQLRLSLSTSDLRVAQAVGEAADARADAAAAGARLVATETNAAALQQELETSQITLSALKQQLAVTSHQRDQLSSQVTRLEEQLMHATALATTATSEESMASLRSKVADLQGELDRRTAAHQTQLNEFVGAVEQLANEQTLVEGTLRQLHGDKARLSAEVDALRVRLQAAEGARDVFQAAVLEAAQAHGQMNAQVHQQQQQQAHSPIPKVSARSAGSGNGDGQGSALQHSSSSSSTSPFTALSSYAARLAGLQEQMVTASSTASRGEDDHDDMSRVAIG